MRRLRLDFAPARRGIAPAAVAVLVAGALALGAALWAYGSERADHDALQAALERRPAAGAPGPTRQVRGPDAIRDEGVLASLGLPWAALFDALEASAGHGVVLTGLQPEAEARRVRISGQARRFDDIAEYAGRLQGTGILANVQLVAHETRDQRTQFTLQADWGGRP